MALTRPRYSQIYDSDFKNSARVATTTNVTLSGGAPTVVDGVTLVLGDRVLVRSQSTAAQNGIYRVSVLGTGSNGTWVRTLDADTADKLSPGTSLSIEEGTTLAGKLYRMTSTNPITLGSTAITWTDVSGGGGSAGGNDGQIQYNDTNAFGGATYLWYNEVTGTITANAGVASTTTTSGTFIVTGGVGVSGALNVGANITVTGNVLPSANVTYNLGSPTQRWKDLFLAGNTINLNGATISAVNGAITFQNSLGGSFSVTGSASGQSTGTFGNLIANSGIVSSSTSTGALVVTGGAGVSGALNVGGDVTITGGLTVNGTTTNINTTNLVIEDKNIIIADVTTPTNVTADGAGITVKGSTDKTFNWVSLTAAWTSSEDLNLLTGKQYEINGTSVLTATTLGSGVTASSLTSLGTIATLVATNSLTTTGVVTNLSSGNIVATNSTSGTWSTANVSLYESVTASTTNATFYPILADKTAGNTGSFSATTLTHNPSTGNLTATGFVGAHYGSAAGLTGSAAGLTSIPSGQLTGTMATSVSSQLFNNMGQGHATRTSFDATTPSYDFGHRFVQGSTNGPGTGGGQFYSWYMGLGSDYPATGAASYGAMFAVDRNSTTPYLSVRYNENNAFGSWRKIQAGYADTAGTVTTAAQTNITSVGTLTGLTVSGAIVPNANLTINVGSVSSWFNTFFGVSTQAKYADLAENYQADAQYVPGTVLVFGGAREVTTTDQDHNTAVAGVVSTNPAHLMNGQLTGPGVVALGLTGRLPCRVQGPVAKGDVLVTSTTPGVAQRIDNAKFLPGCVVGKALESINTNNIQTIEVVVGRF
jgi:hypothetical protein